MMYVGFRKNFLLAHSSELMAVRFISISLAQKRLIPTFYNRVQKCFGKHLLTYLL